VQLTRAPRGGSARHRRLSDERLAALVSRGDATAFEALYDRHLASLLAFCRHMLGNREDGEDALQQAFLRAHRALVAGRVPDAVRPWLFAIARNRCRTMLAARRDAELPVEDAEPSCDGLAEEVRRRAELRELVADVARLPTDQREALVLSELGDLCHGEIAAAIGCPPAKVKALVFQARTALIAERDARAIPCDQIRGQLEDARGGVLRRAPLRRHLRDCEPCRAFQVAVAGQRGRLALLLPVAPSAGLKAAVLGAAGAPAGGGTAAAVTAMAGGGLAAKGLAAKLAVTAAMVGGAASGGVAVDAALEREPARSAGAPTASAPSGVAPRTAEAVASIPLESGTVSDAAQPQRGPAAIALRRQGPVVDRRQPALVQRVFTGPGRRRARLRRLAALGTRDPVRLRRRAAARRRDTIRLRRLRRLAAAGALEGAPPRRLRRLAAAGAPPRRLRRLAAAGVLDGAPPRRLRRLAAAGVLDGAPPRRLRRLAARAGVDAAALQDDGALQRLRRRATRDESDATSGDDAALQPGDAETPAPRRRQRPRGEAPPATEQSAEVTPTPEPTATPQPTATPTATPTPSPDAPA
jgi:RNA polymerase sigma factor (sigma-70 family)